MINTTTERPVNTNTMSVSFRKWLLELTDICAEVSGYKSRSDFVNKACCKQIVFQTKLGDLTELVNRYSPVKIDLGETEKIEITVPKNLKILLEKHSRNYACDINTQFFTTAAFKYFLMKEMPDELADILYDEMQKGNKQLFKAIIT